MFALVTRRLVVTGVLMAVAVVFVLVPGSGAARGTDPMAPATAPPAVPSAGIPMTEDIPSC